MQPVFIAAVCIRMYRTGRTLGSFEVPCSLFVIIPVLVSTSVTVPVAVSCHVFISSSFSLYISVVIIIIIVISSNAGVNARSSVCTVLQCCLVLLSHAILTLY